MTLSRYEQRVLAEMEQDLATRPAFIGFRRWWRRWRSEPAATRGRGVLATLSAVTALTHRVQTRTARSDRQSP
jgi:hypothetical protein